MKVLVIGNGGRESAICWKLFNSNKVSKIYIAPGNGGTLNYGENIDISVDNIVELKKFAVNNKIDLTVVGPEIPLTLGIVDEFGKDGLKIFGPSKEAAELEGSKDFAKKIMKKYKIPTADYETFTEYEEALKYLKNKGVPIVIKADGLAAGKGVTVAFNIDDAINALKDIMLDKIFGESGAKVVIEEYMDGEEASILAFTDGKTIYPMVSSQDHKRIYDGDKGPNTGGMGTYSPAPVVTDEVYKMVYNDILVPMIKGLKEEGIKYKGVLYAGLMISGKEVKVVEFNVRFGDPETQVVLPRLKTDLFEVFEAVAEEKLDKIKLEWDDRVAVCVVMASGGYPGKYEKEKLITGIKEAEENGLLVFHAGTKDENGKVTTNGGRVLDVVSIKDNIKAAVDDIYNKIDSINFENKFYRKDIAHKALKRES
ncbi:phosphoribosylamine--glycine ligase [Haliovirga abyssi]|uniref:Phosphoribosylamine--glycine ligase n=1 Tax=Haliovirga abyssi TaxID=2996794 RepID=A0AAU9D493_9FUSO|nr:phosphoribosylamine--glycine ligase [Haliovirga abyssi]BDU50801.1 phosphoribosylamine--glycine ligase [Haliovirga abyssi]